MYFSIGGHPAFNCPLFKGEAFEDYDIVFSEKENVGTHIITEEGLVSDKMAPFLSESSTIPLDYDIFRKYQTLVFSKMKSSTVTLRSHKTGLGVTVDFSGFSYFGIWTPPDAPFICLEPWQGVDDSPVAVGDLRDKTGTVRLAAGEEYTCGFTISIN
jgi:galactose mutarotase-like enzyme